MVFCSVRNDVLTQVVVKITPWRWRAKRPRWFESSPTLLWESHHHQLFPETKARNYQSLHEIPNEYKSHSHSVRSLKSRNCGSLLSARCFVVLFTCMLVIFRYTKTIPQQVKDKMKWAEIHHLLRLFVMWWSVASFFQILCCVCSEDIMARRA